MKICAVICEYNPFHNGHLYHLNEVKKQSGCDTLICIMSGNFTQRGEIAIQDKYTRAKHAVLGGADIVIELPAVFATAPAEIFASGAVKLLSSIRGEKILSFGTEKGDKDSFMSTAKALLCEDKEFKAVLKDNLKEGKSLAKARTDTVKALKIKGADLELLENPNSILGIEYSKAILGYKSDIDILPIKRIGGGYNDNVIYKNFSSASAIRESIRIMKKKPVKKNVPSFVWEDTDFIVPDADNYIFYSLIIRSAKELEGVIDCTEGLENRLKALAKDSLTFDELISKAVTKRYTRSRIKRICLSNFLGIKEDFVRSCLKSDLYLKILAIDGDRMQLLSELKSACSLPLITRKSDVKDLGGKALECFNKDVEASELFSFITKKKSNEFAMPVIKK